MNVTLPCSAAVAAAAAAAAAACFALLFIEYQNASVLVRCNCSLDVEISGEEYCKVHSSEVVSEALYCL